MSPASITIIAMRPAVREHSAAVAAVRRQRIRRGMALPALPSVLTATVQTRGDEAFGDSDARGHLGGGASNAIATCSCVDTGEFPGYYLGTEIVTMIGGGDGRGEHQR